MQAQLLELITLISSGCMTDEEIAHSRALKEKGIRLEMRQVPAHSAELLNDQL